jgi:cell division septum initiation protein DivIVA
MADTKIDLRDMQKRVDDLGARIAGLRQRVKTGTSLEQAQRTELAALEQRHRELGDTLAKLDRDGARPEHQSMVHKLANDLDASLEKFTNWVDAPEHPAPPPGGFSP